MFLDVFKPGAGHIFLMFDSGVKPDDVERYFLDQSEVVVLNDKVWVPIEATLVGKPFFSAWKQGALKYNCLLYTSPSPRDKHRSRMPSSA